MATISATAYEIRIEPRTSNLIDITFDIDNRNIYDIVESLFDSLQSYEKKDLYDKLKDEGYGND